jgi:hypothetical protein
MCLVTYKYPSSNLQNIKHHLDIQLVRIQKFIISETSFNGVTRNDYDSTLDSRITENFDDASLCLRQVCLHNSRAHPEDIEPNEKAIISSCGKSCLQLLRNMIYRFCDRQSKILLKSLISYRSWITSNLYGQLKVNEGLVLLNE